MATKIGTGGDDFLSGRAGNDILRGLAGDDVLIGNKGNDSLFGGTGSDVLDGGDGNDFINAGTNSSWDVIFGSLGNDRITFADAINPSGSFAFFAVKYSRIEGSINAFISKTATTVKKSIDGSIDRLVNIDWTSSKYDIRIEGTVENDTFRIKDGFSFDFIGIKPGAGNDMIFGGDGGWDRVSYNDQPYRGIRVEVTGYDNGDMTGKVKDQFGDFDKFFGVNEIEGTHASDKFVGGNGNDNFITNAGNDMVLAGQGWDQVRYDRSNLDSVVVDLAKHTAVQKWGGSWEVRKGEWVDTLFGVEAIQGSRGNDSLLGSKQDERLRGNDGNDLIRGRDGNDRLEGENGNDRVFGEGGNDTVSGGDGNDSVYGGGGNDIVFGDTGNDKLWGNAAADTFAIRDLGGSHVIRDYADGVDKIALEGTTKRADISFANDGSGNVDLSFGTTTVKVLNTLASDLQAADFDFGFGF